VLLFAAACGEAQQTIGATATPVVGPDGARGWYAVECHETQANCYKIAGQACPGGYVTQTQQAHDGQVMYANRREANASPTYHGDMLIRCR
jgi:hypothetical protein